VRWMQCKMASIMAYALVAFELVIASVNSVCNGL
jgi:hypothetical protein